MANANAIVDKLANAGLRHGEKAGVAIAMMVFLVCVGIAVSQPTITTTPEQVKKAAQVADTNLSRTDDRDTIIKRLEEKEKIVPTNFATTVENSINTKIDPVVFKPKRDWVSPEPGAGLIREQPKLIALKEIYAYPGRGGLLIYELDESGNKIPDTSGDKSDEPKQQRYGRKRKKSAGGMGGGMGGGMMGGGQRKKHKKSQQEIDRETREANERKTREITSSLAGGGLEATKEDKANSEADKADNGPFKQTTRGYRWVAITGVLDHAKMLENYRQALKNPSIAHPNYARLDLERRTLQEDGTWSDWEKVDQGKNLDILDNLPYAEEELTPATVRPDNLVDPLPFLNAGLWEKVHIARFVSKEKLDLPKEPEPQQQGMAGMMGGGMMQNQMSSMMQQNTGAMQSAMQSQMKNQMSMMGGMMGGGMDGAMGGAMGGMGSSESAGNFWKSEENQVMIRALDFTAERGNSYRYRVRVVVYNPNVNRDDVAHGVDTKDKFLEGPWSRATDAVTMPPDIEPYAVTYLPPSSQTGDKVRFEVISFNPTDGWTVPKRFEAGVGEIIGDTVRVAVPRSDGSGAKQELIDFRTHQLVVDLDGGGLQNLPTGINGPPIERPALAALLRPDGSMVIHTMMDDLANDFRKDVVNNYDHEIKESTKKREKSNGSGYAGMMGGMMGGMGGMMGGGRR
ncbi:MAG: hypothetical protein ACYC61_30035 [Isosphaeraceae bacterium]